MEKTDSSVLAKVHYSLYFVSFLIFKLSVFIIIELWYWFLRAFKSNLNLLILFLWLPNPVLLKLLVSNSMDGILEAVRVFGNLSQDHAIRDFIVQKNGELMTLRFINTHFLPIINSKAVSELRLWQSDTCFRFGTSSALRSVPRICKAVSAGCQDGSRQSSRYSLSLVSGLLSSQRVCV